MPTATKPKVAPPVARSIAPPASAPALNPASFTHRYFRRRNPYVLNFLGSYVATPTREESMKILGDRPGEGIPEAALTATTEGSGWTISEPTAWDTSGFQGLRAILREDRESASVIAPEGRASTIESWLSPGSQALAAHRFGEWVGAGGPPWLLRRPAAFLHVLMSGYVRSVLGFEIAKSVRLGLRVKFFHQHGVVMGGHCVVGDDCVFRHGVTLAPSPKNPSEAPQIGARVSFGAGCIVLGKVRIGDGAIIGPNAVVTTDVPPGASVVAQPARILRIR